jgi:magnesium transporter
VESASRARVLPHELHIFLTPTRVVTVHAEPLQALERVWQRALRGETSTCHGPGSILHALADEMVDQMYPVMDAIDAELEDLHGALLSPKPDPRILRRILVVKQAVREMRRLIGPVREVLGILHRSALPGVTDADRPYLRNVLDHLHVMQQQVEMGREHVADVRDLYMTAQAARTNEIVKRLTVVAVLGLPVTSITGFFGMNFEGLPFASAEVFHAALAGMVVIPVVMMGFMWWRRWV